MASFEAIRGFTPVGQDCSGQLALMEGDKLRVLEKDASGWWAGHKEGENLTGWFPGDAVRLVEVHTSAQNEVQASAAHSQIKAAHSWAPTRSDALSGTTNFREGSSVHRRPSQTKRETGLHLGRAVAQTRAAQSTRRPSQTPFSESRRAARNSPERRPCASPAPTRDGKENANIPSNRARSPMTSSKARQPASSPSRQKAAASPLTTQDGRAVSTPFGNADARGRRRITSSAATVNHRLRLKASGLSAQVAHESPSAMLREIRRSTCSYAPTTQAPKARGSYNCSPRLGGGGPRQPQQRTLDSLTPTVEPEIVTVEAYAAQQEQLQQLQEELRSSRDQWAQISEHQRVLEEELRQLQAQRSTDNDRHHQQQMEIMAQREQHLKSEIRHLTEEKNMAAELRRVGRMEQELAKLRDALSSKERRLTALEGHLNFPAEIEVEMEAEAHAGAAPAEEGAEADALEEEASSVRALIAVYEQRTIPRNPSQECLREQRPSLSGPSLTLSRGSSGDALRSQGNSWFERSPSPVMS